MTIFATALKAVLGILIILGGWLLVQAAWRRVFPGIPADEDILAGRIGCHACPRQPACNPVDCESAEKKDQQFQFRNPKS